MVGNAGYLGIGPEEGVFVPEAEAFTYALERCQTGNEEEVKEFRKMLVDWYFSGNWIKTEGED